MTVDLRTVAERAMAAKGFLVQFPTEALDQMRKEHAPLFESIGVPDMSSMLWSSIDNDDSRDLDQVEFAKAEPGGTRIYVGIADVDWFVPLNSPIDRAAAQ